MLGTAIGTIVIFALIIAVAAIALLRISFHLRVVRKTLGTIYVGCQVISYQTSTVPAVVESVNADLKPVREFCESV
ncbi:MAG: hypothetical protein ACRD0E_02105 [Acidimicrobiales bacterium]